MKSLVKKVIINFASLIINFASLIINLTVFSKRIGGLIIETFISKLMDQTENVSHKNTRLKFSTPNYINKFRAESFSTKEPETLEWIDSLPEGCVLWDIGANVGLYSVYAAKTKGCRVLAFEPSVFNLEILARNLFLNNLQEDVAIIPVALNDKMGINSMRMKSTEWGAALSSFEKKIDYQGKSFQGIFSFQTFGLTMDQAVNFLSLPAPDYIKMDVDGIEHFILQGGPEALRKISGILIEVNDEFKEQAEQTKYLLEKAGLRMLEKRHSEEFDQTKFKNLYNQIWTRDS